MSTCTPPEYVEFQGAFVTHGDRSFSLRHIAYMQLKGCDPYLTMAGDARPFYMLTFPTSALAAVARDRISAETVGFR